MPFYASAPDADGTCNPNNLVYPPQPRVPLYRAWRPFGESNHRFSTDRGVIDAIVAKGWVDEVAVYVLVAIIRKRLSLEFSLHSMLQILSVTPFEKVSLFQLLSDMASAEPSATNPNQLSLS